MHIRYYQITEDDLTNPDYALSSSDVTYLKQSILGYEQADVETIIFYDTKTKTIGVHNKDVFFGKEKLH